MTWAAKTPNLPRPGGITVLSVLGILIGLLGIGGGALLLLSSNLIVATLSALALFIGALYVVAGIGFFRGRRWSWSLGLLVSALSLGRNLVEIITGAVAFGIPGVIVAIVMIYYLSRPSVRAFLGSGRI